MEVYTVSLFGHKEINNPLKVGKQLEKEVRDLIDHYEYVEFLIGRNGMFDLFAASVIREVCKEYDYGNAALVLVLPHITPDYNNNSAMIDKMYDEIEVCEEAEFACLSKIYGMEVNRLPQSIIPHQDINDNSIPYWRLVGDGGVIVEGRGGSREFVKESLIEEGVPVVQRGKLENSFRVDNYKDYLFDFSTLTPVNT